MRNHGRVGRMLAMAAGAAVCLIAQHQNSTGAKTPTAIEPARMPPSIGLSPRSIGLSPPSIGTSPSPLRPTPALSAPVFSGQTRPDYRSPDGRGRDRRNRALPYAFVGAPFFLPNLGNSYAAGDDAPPAEPPTTTDQSELSDQIKRLSAQIQDLQEQINRSPTPPQPVPGNDDSSTAGAAPPITIVTKAGQTMQTANYAVIGSMFWDLSSEPARKIPLTSIDITASKRATEASGAEFPALAAVR